MMPTFATEGETPVEDVCSFCDKLRSEVRLLIPGWGLEREAPPRAFICDECVALAGEIVNEELGASATSE